MQKSTQKKIFETGMVFGTFDLFHLWHEFYIRSAKKFCKNLVVVIARDARVLSGKGFFPNDSENIRKNNIDRFLIKNFFKKSEKIEKIIKIFSKNQKNFSKFHQKNKNAVTQKMLEIQQIIQLKNFAHEKNKTFAVLGDEADIFAPIRFFEPKILFFGYDQRVPENILQEKFPHILTKRIGGYKTEKYKSSLLRKKLTK